MTKKSYNQYCALARGLDLVGDRWTLLVVRDLLLGPMRYGDLAAGLPGISTNMLADRLRALESAGIVARATLPPPAGSAVYQLTETGEALEPVLLALGRWGARFLGKPEDEDVFVPRSYFVAIRARFRPEDAADTRITWELRIGSQVYEVRVADRRCTTRQGAAVNPDVVMSMDEETLNALLIERQPWRRARKEGRLRVLQGDDTSVERFFELFGTPMWVRSGDRVAG
ncbi:MAG: helix-turn-helix transcriptional regulator [Candidatus Dormibacteraeota bacterium]|nr:helix-turn-helix transcriptional regulator [Candidatus Dormibacteraeota bacterium]